MSTESTVASGPPLPGAEEGAAGLKTKTAAAAAEEEEVAVVDAQKARWIKRGLDVFFVVYLLFYIAVVGLMIMVSDKWWDPWPGVAFISPICITTLWLTPTMKDVYIQLYATKKIAKSNIDLATKLLALEK